MKHPSSPSSKAVLDSVKDLPTNGTVAQDDENGMVYLNLDDDWIFHSLKVLRDSYLKMKGLSLVLHAPDQSFHRDVPCEP